MAFRASDFFFACGLDLSRGHLISLRSNVANSELLLAENESQYVHPDRKRLYTDRWHTATTEIYPDRNTLGTELCRIIDRLPQWLYMRGALLYPHDQELPSRVYPRIRQLVLTSADYCKLYVHVLQVYVVRRASELSIHCSSNELTYVPMSYGIISRIPYLTFPRVFLSQLYYIIFQSPQASLRPLLTQLIGQAMHCVALPPNSLSVSCVYLPKLKVQRADEPQVVQEGPGQAQLLLRECGMYGGPQGEGGPIQNSFFRGFGDVDFLALLDLLSIDVVLLTVGAILLEQKVLLVSARWPSSLIAHICEALRALIYPFDWHHVFMPFLPPTDVEDIGATAPMRGGGMMHVPLPFWIPSARSTDHVHPLRFLEAPAPVLAGLRVRLNDNNNLSQYDPSPMQQWLGNFPSLAHLVRSRFSDVNVVDLDDNLFIAATTRVDKVDQPLPPLPRKIAQGISQRLSFISEKFPGRMVSSTSATDGPPMPSPSFESTMGGYTTAIEFVKNRLAKYLRWDEVVPLSILTGEPSALSRSESPSLQHLSSMGILSAANSTPASPNAARRSSGALRRPNIPATVITTSGRSGTAPTQQQSINAPPLVSSTSPSQANSGGESKPSSWLGTFAALFKGGRSPMPPSPRPGSASGGGGLTNLGGRDGDSSAAMVIQAAMIEAFVKLFFCYRDFLQSVAGNASMDGDFVGGDRHFLTDNFMRCCARSGFSADTLLFLRSFLSTQCWDMFVRTAALYPINAVFDAACSIFCAVHKADVLKFRQAWPLPALTVPTILQPTPESAEAARWVRACPSGVKLRDHYFEELLAFIVKQHDPKEVIVSAEPQIDASLFSAIPSGGAVTSFSAAEDAILKVLREDLPRLYSDANIEALKSLKLRSGEDSDARLVVETFPNIFKREARHHIVHSLMAAISSNSGNRILTMTKLQRSGSDLPNGPPGPEDSEDIEYLASSDGLSISGGISAIVAAAAGAGIGVVSGGSGASNTLAIPKGGDNADTVSSGTVSGHSGRSSSHGGFGGLLPRGITISPDESHLLGGIPRTAFTARMPVVSRSLMRSWGSSSRGSQKQRDGWLRVMMRLSGTTQIDTSCPACGCNASLVDILKNSNYLTPSETSALQSRCSSCDTSFCPLLVLASSPNNPNQLNTLQSAANPASSLDLSSPSSTAIGTFGRKAAKVLPVAFVVEHLTAYVNALDAVQTANNSNNNGGGSTSGPPPRLNWEVAANLRMLMGISVEVYTASGVVAAVPTSSSGNIKIVPKRVLRGVLSLTDALKDFSDVIRNRNEPELTSSPVTTTNSAGLFPGRGLTPLAGSAEFGQFPDRMPSHSSSVDLNQTSPGASPMRSRASPVAGGIEPLETRFSVAAAVPDKGMESAATGGGGSRNAPMTPRSRALYRIAQYRKNLKRREEESEKRVKGILHNAAAQHSSAHGIEGVVKKLVIHLESASTATRSRLSPRAVAPPVPPPPPPAPVSPVAAPPSLELKLPQIEIVTDSNMPPPPAAPRPDDAAPRRPRRSNGRSSTSGASTSKAVDIDTIDHITLHL